LICIEELGVAFPALKVSSLESLPILRKFPYPFKAGFSICSDIDETDDLDRFLEIQKFLNTRRMTSIGKGLGLEIGNTFLMYETPNTLFYYSGNKRYVDVLRTLIKAGYVDCIHSFGDNARHREDTIKAINDLKRNNCFVKVWVDHSCAASNFGRHSTKGTGDSPGSPIYHSDQTLKYGIKFISRGTVSRIIGQETPLKIKSVLTICNLSFPVKSTITMMREIAKLGLSFCGSNRYSMHWDNNLIKVRTLADGQKVFEFLRFNNHFAGGSDAKCLAYTMQPKVLDYLKQVNGYMIVYTHLGRNPDSSLIPGATVQALRNLAQQFRHGEIYVTTTSKLLSYLVNHRFLNWSYNSNNDNNLAIHIHGVDDPVSGYYVPTEKELAGLTFYIPGDKHTEVFLEGRKVNCITTNPSDYTGQKSIMFPLRPLSYPKELQ
jgi:hypothetical protein